MTPDKEKHMTTQIGAPGCGGCDSPRASRISARGIVGFIAVAAVALVIVYAETWVIQEVPVWASACVRMPSSNAGSDGDTPLRDTAGPIAVLH